MRSSLHALHRLLGLGVALLSAGCSESVQPAGPAVPAALEALTPTMLAGMVTATASPAPTVRVSARTGAPLAGVPVSFLSSDPPRQALVATGVDGTATMTWTFGTRSGRATLSANVAGLSPVLFTAELEPGPATTITPLTAGLWAAAGATVTQPLQVRVTDAHQNPIAGLTVTFAIEEGDGSIEHGITRTDVSGTATPGRWTMGAMPGPQRLRARAGDATTTIVAHACDGACGTRGKLLFVRDDQIYRSDADGGNAVRLTHAGDNHQPAWAPDGARFAFVRTTSAFNSEVYISDAEGEHPTRRTSGFSPAWSHDGRRIGVGGQCDGQGCLLVMPADDDGTPAVRMGNPAGFHDHPAWSPDGTRIAFTSDWDGFDFVYDIYVTDGQRTIQMTRGYGIWPKLEYSQHAVWSPDGQEIAYVRGHIINAADMRFHVAVMDVRAPGVYRDLAWAGDIPWHSLLDPGSIAWAPDGSGIAFTFVDCDLTVPRCTNERSIRFVSLGSPTPRILVPNASSPSWVP